jgi:3-oxoadipate CoA-transferase alpha subunit
MDALSQIKNGSTVMIGGFGTAGQPAELIDGLIKLGIKDLVIVINKHSLCCRSIVFRQHRES